MPAPVPTIPEYLYEMLGATSYWGDISWDPDSLDWSGAALLPGGNSLGGSLWNEASIDYFNMYEWLDAYGYALPVYGGRAGEEDLINWASDVQLSAIEQQLKSDIYANQLSSDFAGISKFGGNRYKKFQADSLISTLNKYKRIGALRQGYSDEMYNAFGTLATTGAFDPEGADWMEYGASWEDYYDYLGEMGLGESGTGMTEEGILSGEDLLSGLAPEAPGTEYSGAFYGEYPCELWFQEVFSNWGGSINPGQYDEWAAGGSAPLEVEDWIAANAPPGCMTDISTAVAAGDIPGEGENWWGPGEGGGIPPANCEEDYIPGISVSCEDSGMVTCCDCSCADQEDWCPSC